MRLISIGETVAELGVAVGTLRRWHRPWLLMRSAALSADIGETRVTRFARAWALG
jgi:hypothetical protein